MEKNYYNEIKKELLNNEIYIKVKDYSKNRNELSTYYNVGKLLIEAQGGEDRAKYGDGLIKEYSLKLSQEIGKKYNITDDKFNWSPDDPCIDSTVTLDDEEARSIYEAELRDRYIQCAKLTPEKLDGVVRDSLLKLDFTVGASNVVFLEISKR